MSFIYDSSLSSNKDLVRFHLGDTVEDLAYLSDEEIEAVLAAENTDVFRATARLARGLANRFAREMSVRQSNAGLHEDAIERAKFFQAIAAEFEQKAVTSGLVGFFSAADSTATGSTPKEPAFTRDLHEVDSVL